jgi:hypothetical protein
LERLANQFEIPKDNKERVEAIRQDINDQIGCRLSGSFLIDKVSGNFHISYHKYIDSYYEFKARFHDEFMKLNLSYEIEDLHFGLEQNKENMPKIRKLLEDLELSDQLLDNYVDHTQNNYNYFIGGFWMEIIPYTFTDNRTGFEFRSLQHSFNRKIKAS